MKIKFLLLTFVLPSISFGQFQNAVKASEGNKLIELRLSDFPNSIKGDINSQYGGFMIRSFNTNQDVTRMSLDFNFVGNNDINTEVDIKNIKFMIGTEEHFQGSQNFSPYWGVACGMQAKSSKGGNVKMDANALANIFTGFDFYLTSDLYTGMEIGYTLSYGTITPLSGGVIMNSSLKFGYKLQ